MDPVFETYLRRTLEVERRKPPEVPTHVIIVGESDHWYARYCREHYHTKTVPMPAFPMEHEIFAYQDQVIILMYHTSELSGIVIESRSLADGIRSMFDLVWSYAPDLHGGSARV